VRDADGTPAGVLVRPDGVVAWACDGIGATTGTAAAEGLDAALRRWAGAPAPSLAR
jgi:hypothetical protein